MNHLVGVNAHRRRFNGRPGPFSRRAMVVKITEAGYALLDTVLPEHYRRVTAVMTRLDETQRTALQTLLGQIGVPEKAGEELC